MIENENKTMPFDLLTDDIPSIIKVIGVGGGGGNAVNHMYKEGIKGVTFALCNTDNQALVRSSIPVKLQLGPQTTHGLGAGNNPPKAKDAAEESIEDIRRLLSDGTQMVFITAGMGGGTGTGAAPVVARVAKEMNILTIGIVTIPFLFEGKEKIMQAIAGLDQIKENVDALMIINNERLRSIYQDLTFINAFTKADDTLSVAARSIVEIITEQGIMNLDFADVCTTLRNGGVAIISSGIGEGDMRVEKAIQNALHSPLLNNTDIVNAQKILIYLTFGEDSNFMMEEVNAIHDFMKRLNPNVKVIWGYGIDNSLDMSVKVTLLASGFDVRDFSGEEISEEIEEAKQTRIKEIYGDDLIAGIQRNRAKKRYLYIFSPEDLDNEDIISMVEMSPTYNRTKSTLESIRSKAVIESEEMEGSATDSDSNLITFG